MPGIHSTETSSTANFVEQPSLRLIIALYFDISYILMDECGFNYGNLL